MKDIERRAAAKQFIADWTGRGDEKQETQSFWLSLLRQVFGVAEPEKYISFERRVEVDDTRTGKSTTKFIDCYITETRVLIEQKGQDIDELLHTDLTSLEDITHRNASNARYCEYCGQPTILLKEEMLKPYTEVQSSQDVQEDEELPFDTDNFPF